jgi:hypothetical protein
MARSCRADLSNKPANLPQFTAREAKTLVAVKERSSDQHAANEQGGEKTYAGDTL